MSYVSPSNLILENGILRVPSENIIDIFENTYFSFKYENVIYTDSFVDIKKNMRPILEKLMLIFGISPSEIKRMKKKDLIEYIQNRIIFENHQ
jgi:hypothetical protein